MATNLAGGVCIGQHSVCLLRAALLEADCTVQGGADSGIVTSGIVTMTATPEYQDTTTFEPETGCGDIGFTYEKIGGLRRENITGELLFHDWEAMLILFGGTLVLGENPGPFADEVIGWCAPNYTDPTPPSVYLEVIVQNAAAGFGECAPPGAPFPTYTGHIFGKARLTPDARTFAREVANVGFTGVSTANPNLINGPWNDWPGQGVICNSPYVTVAYSQAQYEAILADSACGLQTLPTPYT